ncbi:hypothetical protein GGF43_001344 [Coemansia sp. RSA 2618]|nr:hypothetical protein GGF43_001344 [Coemansia sp. RSA 2618]
MRCKIRIGWLAAGTLLLAQAVQAVKREDFKTCDQAAFCQRHRQFAEGGAHEPQAAYAVVSSSVRLEQHTLEALIENQADHVPLQVAVSFLASGVVRMRVQEQSPLAPRFDDTQKHVLRGEGQALEYAQADDLQLASEKTDGAAVHTVSYASSNATFSVRMTEQPWSLTYLVDGKPSVQLNAKGFFRFEHLRSRPEDAPEGEWSEKFGSWTDTKPRGPESLGMDIRFAGAEHVYGIPEHSSPLSLKATRGKDAYDQPYRLYNLDVFEYEIDNPMALYGSVPLMLAHSADATSGVLWLNAAETWVDVEHVRGGLFRRGAAVDTHWISEAGVMDVFVLPGPGVADVFAQYAELVEPTPLPREFALGYHQCRWNYLDTADVLGVSAGLHEHDIPYDVMWLDIEHTDGKRYFTWDTAKFPDPSAMQRALAHDGHRMVAVVDPHVKHDTEYAVWSDANARDLFVKARDGSNFQGWCWPGDSNWLDCFNPSATEWLGEQYRLDRYNGSTTDLFVWNDMNEPSVFNGPEITMDKDAVHHGGWEHRQVHNANGMLYHKATADGLRARTDPALRPFVLSRAYFAGSRRYGAIWTGDNTASWEHLRASVPMVLSNNVAGIHFIGADVGGFFGNPDAQLLTRWYQLGIWYPFFRAHAHIDTKRREPWLMGEPYLTHIRAAIRQRYRLLPYLYTLFRETSLTGLPLLRPMWVEFPRETSLFAEDAAFMVGSALMVVPVTEAAESQSVRVVFPSDEIWYDLHSHAAYAAPLTRQFTVQLADTLVFARGGSIVPTRERRRRSSALMQRDPFTLYVYANRAGSASGQLYMDDGESYAYEGGAFIERELTFANASLASRPSARSVVSAEQTAFAAAMAGIRVERVVVVGLSRAFTEATVVEDGAERTVDVTCREAECTIRDPAVRIAGDWDIRLG